MCKYRIEEEQGKIRVRTVGKTESLSVTTVLTSPLSKKVHCSYRKKALGNVIPWNGSLDLCWTDETPSANSLEFNGDNIS